MSNTVSLKLREKLPVTESQFAFTVICEDFIYLREHHISGIPEIQELVEEDGQLYVIEEYINGVSLKEVLDERAPAFPSSCKLYAAALSHTATSAHPLSANCP